MADIVTDIKVAEVVFKRSTAALLCIACFAGGVILAEAYEHTFDFKFLFVHVQGLGPKARNAVKDLNSERAAHVRDNATCKASIGTLTGAVAAQNAAVAAWKAEAAQRSAEAQKAVSEAEKATAAHRPIIQRIMTAPAATCADIHGLRGMQ